ncbi:MAG TPA: UDP binding domain-containing protein, partial [Smithellaceae bacterium]|nr:UDP binding domain-containing protein [Smithellaceae bacterium]
GSCFKKDILNLVYLCHFYGLPEVAAYWESVVKMNDYQQRRFIANILRSMFNTLAGKKVCVMGFSFKADTGDTRESPALYITRMLLEEHAEVVITDPKALKNAADDLKRDKGKIQYREDPYEAAAGCHALVILTDWNVYKTLDYQRIYTSMVKPAFIFDGRNIVDLQKCFEIGFNVFPVGKPAWTHF